MKFSNCILLILISTVYFISSCQKNVDSAPAGPPPQIGDSIKPVLPKQIIWTTLGAYDSLITDVVSIKYDTLNRQIGLYFDDTTNTNPYDRLAVSYTYNNNGYLIKATGFDGNGPVFSKTIVDINRGIDDKIIYIATDDNYAGKDTAFYSYQSLSEGTDISIVTHFNSSPSVLDTDLYKYDTDFKISYFQFQGGNVTFEYNQNASINKITLRSGTNFRLDFNYFYASGLADEKEDLFYKLLMGKDHYLPELKKLYPFQFCSEWVYGIYGVSITNPHHVSRTTDIHPFLGPDEEGTFSYDYNDRNLLSKVTFKKDGQLSGIAKLKY